MNFETAETVTRWVGLSQLVQVPVTAFLGSEKGLGLAREIGKMPPLVSAIVRVVSGSFVVMLVMLAVLVALYPADVLRTHLGSALAGFLGVLLLARLGVQLYYGRHWPPRLRFWHILMCFVIFVQGAGNLFVWAISSP
jgi:hypothetical protein